MKQSIMSKPLFDDFPKSAADWERVIAAAPEKHRPSTAEGLAQMKRSVAVYEGGPLAVREALAKRKRGLGRKPSKKQVTLRLEPTILARWKASGSGWQTRIAQVLTQYAP